MQQLRGKGWYLFPGEINAMVFTPDGRTLVTGSSADQGWDQHVRLWDLETRRQVKVLKSHRAGVDAIAVSSDGRFVASGGGAILRGWSWVRDSEVRIWSLDSGKVVARVAPHDQPADVHRLVKAVAFLNDGNQLLTATTNDHPQRCLTVWSLDAADELRSIGSHPHGLIGAAVSPSGRAVVAIARPGYGEQTIRAFDLETGEAIPMASYAKPIWGVTFCKGANRFITAGSETVVWDLDEGKALLTMSAPTNALAVAVTPDDRHIVTAHGDKFENGAPWEDCCVRVHDLETGEERAVLEGHQVGVSAVACSPDGQYIASGDEAGKVWLWQNPAA